MANDIAKKAQSIRLLILDVDGVLSDNKLIYGDDGQEYKAFFTRDGHGMVMLQKSGIDIAIITGRRSPLTEKRMQDLKVKHLYQGVPDKLPTFLKLVEELGLTLEQIAYVGDDILDLPLLTRVGLAVSPADADPEVRSRVDYISRYNGGQGCVREVCELLMKAQGLWQAQMDFYLR
ncbi:3-deoxy-manno-octulosonate-8-phosphatase KdsC [Thiomicrospira sp. WB1]|uniref:3-deoxy-manno-octulosonate-8-phosphatase KdsC n=1 Tax=Thiomicrospira sp. WB1 TaxID=1685380 RepID=UPI000749C6FE|nr:3-deoxy-manno-octulosonate-8-phosphatase KdsC [Thiomicrospira sp. WB1]KUJ72863.1 phenylphosphate carboxylase subunit delta [Thiomicrospira sp. WB1]